MTHPIVSILILTHDRLSLSSVHIPKIIESIGNVSCEVLILDNASTDGSLDWLCQYSQCVTHSIKIFADAENTGMEAINTLAREATGKYILKVDDDITVPPKFAERMIAVYKEVNDPKMLFMGWDMKWGQNTFATRFGKKVFKEPNGRIVNFSHGCVYITYRPDLFFINGVCRLCEKEKFFAIGGHPQGVIYGVDQLISITAKKAGYSIGYYHCKDLIIHNGTRDAPIYRKFKDRELVRLGCKKHV